MKQTGNVDAVTYGSRRIDYRIHFSGRKTLGIKVTPAMEVEVTAPEGAAPERIRELVRRKARWIQKQQRFFLSFHPKPEPRRYRSGETHYYLGRQMLLRVRAGDEPGVRYQGRSLEVTAASSKEAESLLTKWYRQRAAEKFPLFLAPLAERFARYAVRPSGMALKRMTGRWGSCSGKGRITLHPDLIKAPRGCIEYVITHELCHLVHRNHDRRFWELQMKMMPDWMKWKNRLEKLLA